MAKVSFKYETSRDLLFVQTADQGEGIEGRNWKRIILVKVQKPCYEVLLMLGVSPYAFPLLEFSSYMFKLDRKMFLVRIPDISKL